MRNIWHARYLTDILGIGERVQNQHLGCCFGRSLTISPPGKSIRLRVSQTQGDWQGIVRSDFNDPFRRRPPLIRVRLTQVEHTRVEHPINPEYSAPNELRIGIETQTVEVLLLRWGLDGAILGRRSQGRRSRPEVCDDSRESRGNVRGGGGSE